VVPAHQIVGIFDVDGRHSDIEEEKLARKERFEARRGPPDRRRDRGAYAAVLEARANRRSQQALIAVCWRCGLRIGEALALAVKDFEPDSGTLVVQHGKGGKRRVVGVDAGTAALVSRWLESALVAIQEIIEQGEGTRRLGDSPLRPVPVHSARVRGDASRRPDLRAGARPVLAAFLRQPFDIPTAQPLITDADACRIAELAGLTYELILGVLLRLFTHTDESNAQLGTLFGGALALMAKVLQPLGTALTTLLVGSSYPGRTTGFAFEMHYVLGNMTFHREPAWALLAERARLLAHRCSEVAAEPSRHADLPAVTGEAAAHAHAIADALTAQVPAELRPEPGQAIRL
jgi:Phage integrase family